MSNNRGRGMIRCTPRSNHFTSLHPTSMLDGSEAMRAGVRAGS